MVDQLSSESLDAIEILVAGAGASSSLQNQGLLESSPSPDGQNSMPGDAKRYYCQRCLNHNLEYQRKGHKPRCKYATCQCDLCMMVEKRRQINNQLQRRNPNTPASLPEGKRERKPKCARCSAHGVKQDLRGHKKALCPFIGCNCNLCGLVEDRRILMAKQIRIRRDQQKQKKRQHVSPDTDTSSMSSFPEVLNDESSTLPTPIMPTSTQCSMFHQVDQLMITPTSSIEHDITPESESLPTPMPPINPSIVSDLCIDTNAALLRLQQIAMRQQLAHNLKQLFPIQQFLQPSAVSSFLPFAQNLSLQAFPTPTVFPVPPPPPPPPVPAPFNLAIPQPPVTTTVSPELVLQYLAAMTNLGLTLGSVASSSSAGSSPTTSAKADSPIGASVQSLPF